MEWELDSVVAKRCGISENVCAQIRTFKDQGYTTPFIYRYRASHIEGASPEKVQNVLESIADLRRVTERVSRLISRNQVKHGKVPMADDPVPLEDDPESPQEQDKSMDAFSPEIEACLRTCITMEDVDAVLLPFKKQRVSRFDQLTHQGYIQYILDSGAKHPENLTRQIGHDLKAVEASIVEGLCLLIAREANMYRVYTEGLSNPVVMSRRNERSQVLMEDVGAFIGPKSEDTYQHYFDFSCLLSSMKPHHVCALNRAKTKRLLRISFQYKPHVVSQNHRQVRLSSSMCRHFELHSGFSPGRTEQLCVASIEACWKKIVQPHHERALWKGLVQKATEEALQIFAGNLKYLLLTQPLTLPSQTMLLAIDPGFKHGCKYAVLNQEGKVVSYGTFYLQHESERLAARAVLLQYPISVAAVGDGKGSQEVKATLLPYLNNRDEGFALQQILTVNECGVSIWSVTAEAEKDLPGIHPLMKGPIILGRRLLDPLGEYTKIESRHLGIGIYQLDLPQEKLRRAAKHVLENCVSLVGVDLNQAPRHVLMHVGSIGSKRAEAILKFRESHGPFKSKLELMQVPGIGESVFRQCMGFMRIRKQFQPTFSIESLDSTWIHYDQYPLAERIVALASSATRCPNYKAAVAQWWSTKPRLENVSQDEIQFIVDGLTSDQGYIDIRHALPQTPIVTRALTIQELVVGSRLSQCRVANVTSFGVFVDLGIQRHGLIHSRNKGSRHYELGQHVDVEVLHVDLDRHRVSLKPCD